MPPHFYGPKQVTLTDLHGIFTVIFFMFFANTGVSELAIGHCHPALQQRLQTGHFRVGNRKVFEAKNEISSL